MLPVALFPHAIMQIDCGWNHGSHLNVMSASVNKLRRAERKRGRVWALGALSQLVFYTAWSVSSLEAAAWRERIVCASRGGFFWLGYYCESK